MQLGAPHLMTRHTLLPPARDDRCTAAMVLGVLGSTGCIGPWDYMWYVRGWWWCRNGTCVCGVSLMPMYASRTYKVCVCGTYGWEWRGLVNGWSAHMLWHSMWFTHEHAAMCSPVRVYACGGHVITMLVQVVLQVNCCNLVWYVVTVPLLAVTGICTALQGCSDEQSE